MQPKERDEILARLDAITAEVLAMNGVSTHFGFGAFYAIDRARQIIRATDHQEDS